MRVFWAPYTYIEVYFLPFWDLRSSESGEETQKLFHKQGQLEPSHSRGQPASNLGWPPLLSCTLAPNRACLC